LEHALRAPKQFKTAFNVLLPTSAQNVSQRIFLNQLLQLNVLLAPKKCTAVDLALQRQFAQAVNQGV
jgi:hypothetical protein